MAESYNGIDYTEEEGVIVCKKEDGTYHYYYKSEFKKLIEEKIAAVHRNRRNESGRIYGTTGI